MRIRSSFLVLAAIAAACSSPATAQTPPEELTWMVLNEINSDYFNRAEPMNRPALVHRVPDGMIRAVDVSHDDKPDWLIDYGPSGMSRCGTGGCLTTLYISDGDDYVMGFDAQALDFQIGRAGGETRVEAQVHHTNCVPESRDCRFAWAWDPDARRLVERPNSRGATHLTGGGFDPLENDRWPIAPRDEDMPEAVSQTWYGTRLTCPDHSDAGFETRRAKVQDVADLNGDGVRDWLFEPPTGCQRDPDVEEPNPGFQVWLSQPDGAFAESYQSRQNRWPAIDIAASPAFLIDNPGCGYGETCPNQRLRWDAASRTFRPAN